MSQGNIKTSPFPVANGLQQGVNQLGNEPKHFAMK